VAFRPCLTTGLAFSSPFHYETDLYYNKKPIGNYLQLYLGTTTFVVLGTSTLVVDCCLFIKDLILPNMESNPPLIIGKLRVGFF
jgi:hypothetical protein